MDQITSYTFSTAELKKKKKCSFGYSKRQTSITVINTKNRQACKCINNVKVITNTSRLKPYRGAVGLSTLIVTLLIVFMLHWVCLHWKQPQKELTFFFCYSIQKGVKAKRM